MNTPTILVLGIKGTTLVNTNTLDFDTIWPGIQSKFESIFDLELPLEPRFETEPKMIIGMGSNQAKCMIEQEKSEKLEKSYSSSALECPFWS